MMRMRWRLNKRRATKRAQPHPPTIFLYCESFGIGRLDSAALRMKRSRCLKREIKGLKVLFGVHVFFSDGCTLVETAQ